ncbi:MAG: hypothetical protein BK997_01495 [Candidatus Micrarchaeum sp. ARMAN-1]|nr:MAG: hypothetical protein BK997_01495 [Candidatus Micrarchaeum sp. ARMAN-1]
MEIKKALGRNENLLMQGGIAILIIAFMRSYWPMALLLGIAYALLIIDTKANVIHSERLLGANGNVGNMIESHDRSCLLSKSSNGYVAIAASSISGPGNAKLDRDSMESIVSKAEFPFRFMVSIERVDLKNFMEKLQTKKRIKEIQLSRLDRSHQKSAAIEARLRAEISHLSDEIEDFVSGGTPVNVHYYIIVSEYGDNAYAAQNSAKMAIKQVSSLFDSVLGSTSKVMKGAEISRAIH